MKQASCLVTDPHHQEDFEESRDEGCMTDLFELSQAEFQAEGKHQQDHAQFREGLDCLLVFDEGEGRCVRTDDHSSEDVAQHDRLLETVKHHRNQSGHNHDDRKVLKKRNSVHESFSPKLFVEHHDRNHEADAGDDLANASLGYALGVVGTEEISRHRAGGHRERFRPVDQSGEYERLMIELRTVFTAFISWMLVRPR